MIPNRATHHICYLILVVNPSRSDPGQMKLNKIFVFRLLCGASNGFMKAFKAPQGTVKIKI